MKKIITLLLALVMVLSLVACGEKEPVETTPPAPTEPPLPTNLFTNQNDSLNYFTINGKTYEISRNLVQELQSNGMRIGTKDVNVAINLGYPKGDAKYLCYKYDPNAIDCVYCCVVDEYCKITISYKTVTPAKLGLDTEEFMTANKNTVYAGALGADMLASDVLKVMGEPTELIQKEDGEITGATYIYKDETGKTINKTEIEFVAEYLYKITITKMV